MKLIHYHSLYYRHCHYFTFQFSSNFFVASWV